jgi:hypothetical protein
VSRVQRVDERAGGRFWGSVGVFLSLAGVSAAMTILFLGMRAVMEIGGFCAEGGPYQIAQHCPKGVPILMVGSIWGGLILVGVYVWQCARYEVPSLALLLWPALFLSLGWNFLEFGLNPPGEGGLAWGWLICAVVFVVMGAAPLFFMVPSIRQSMKDEASSRSGGPEEPRRRAAPSIWTPPGPSAGAAGAEPRQPDRGASAAALAPDLVSALERLDYLHRTGAIDDEEYEAAKQRVIEGGAL